MFNHNLVGAEYRWSRGAGAGNEHAIQGFLPQWLASLKGIDSADLTRHSLIFTLGPGAQQACLAIPAFGHSCIQDPFWPGGNEQYIFAQDWCVALCAVIARLA